MPAPQYKAITIALPNSTLPELLIFRGDDNWVKRSVVRSQLEERTIVGVPTYAGRPSYFKYEVSCLLIGQAEWLLFEEIVALSHWRFQAGLDGRINLSDYYYPVVQAEWTLGARQVLPDTTFSIGGRTAAYCKMPVFLSVSNDYTNYSGGNFWPTSFSMEELGAI